MRKLALVLILAGAALLADGQAPADATSFSAARYEWSGGIGELTIVGQAGQPWAVATSSGDMVGSGVVTPQVTTVTVPNTGFGPDGAILHVGIGGAVLSVVDPNWAWD